ncbi:unnamed protein product, partial [Nesidiocoris tenuis]
MGRLQRETLPPPGPPGQTHLADSSGDGYGAPGVEEGLPGMRLDPPGTDWKGSPRLGDDLVQREQEVM